MSAQEARSRPAPATKHHATSQTNCYFTQSVNLDGHSGSMTSWNCKARLFVFVFLSTIDLSYGGCTELLEVNKWGDNLAQIFSLVEAKNPEHIAECTWEREYIQHKSNASRYILGHCFQRKRSNEISDKCQGNTSVTIPYYHLMCLTIEAFNHKETDEKIEAKHCEYDTVCKYLSGGPSTATPTTVPERTVVTPTTTTTELPSTDQSTLPQAPPERNTSAIPPKETPTLPPPSSPPPSSSPPTTTTTSTTTDLVNATPTTLPERTVVTPTTTTTELPSTTTNFTQINGLNRSTTLPLTTTQPERTTSATRQVPPTMTTTEIPPPLPTDLGNATSEKRLANEKEATENAALKIIIVISAALNIAALMIILYQCKRNPGLRHESVSTYTLDGASLETQRMTELKPLRASVSGLVVETTCLIKPAAPDSISTHSPSNGRRVGNEE